MAITGQDIKIIETIMNNNKSINSYNKYASHGVAGKTGGIMACYPDMKRKDEGGQTNYIGLTRSTE